MSDIVEMLRKGEKEGVDGWWGTMAAAADEIELLRLRMSAILTWHANWDAPFHDDDEWREDLRLAKAALRGEPT